MNLQKVKDSFPFITCIKVQDKEFICIVQNQDEKIISVYDIEAIRKESDLKNILDLGSLWWFESNRKIPINIFLGDKMESFRHILKTFNVKDVEIVFGPVISLNDLITRRIKRRQIQLIRKM